MGMGSPSRPERPYRGLFGSPSGDSHQQLIVDGSGGLTWNGSASTDAGGSATALNSGAGSGGSGSTEVVYLYEKDRWGINASNSWYADYFPQVVGQALQLRDIATGAVYFVPAAATRVTVTQGFKNLPEFSYSDLFDPQVIDVVPPVQDASLIVDRFKRYGITAEVSQRLTARTRADLSVGWAHGSITSGRHWTTLLIDGELSHKLAKDLEVYAGYAYGEQTYSDLVVQNVQDRHPTIRLGANYGKALSFSRRTTVGFSTGIAQIRDRLTGETTFHLIGAVSLKREFGRTWDTAVVVSRNVQYIEALATPLFNDGLGAVVHGSFSRRLQFRSGVGISRGHLGSSQATSFDSRYASTQLSIAMTRYVAAGVDYAYSQLPTSKAGLPLDASGQLNGHTVRATLQLWLPLISQAKR